MSQQLKVISSVRLQPTPTNPGTKATFLAREPIEREGFMPGDLLLLDHLSIREVT